MPECSVYCSGSVYIEIKKLIQLTLRETQKNAVEKFVCDERLYFILYHLTSLMLTQLYRCVVSAIVNICLLYTSDAADE